ncbi:MAG TPA: hypothetical protein VMG58_13585, partial [Candidatus Sulfotelmatobacter sp.]|nr:hypothetical protein [Candidatus Sulfotelmatobacter sp.]
MRSMPIRSGGGQRLIRLALVLTLVALVVSPAAAVAPTRAGQPYAEATLCARADVILCEDFDYPGNFSMSGGNTTWNNPALTTKTFAVTGGTAARQINPASQYPAQPAGSPSGGSVWVANWDPSKGTQGDGATWGVLRAVGGNYVNGLAPGKDIYIRFQYYVTSNYAWPGDPRPDAYGYGSSAFPVDNKILFLYPPEGVNNPTGSAYDAGLYTNFSVYDPTTNSRFA